MFISTKKVFFIPGKVGLKPIVFLSLLLLPLFGGRGIAAVWLKGDLHCHSTYSDGDFSVGKVVKKAKSMGLDFITITDHDSMMHGFPKQWYDNGFQSNKLVLLYGIEWTTEKGHANIWGARRFSYKKIWNANKRGNARLAVKHAHAGDALFSINHPFNIKHRWEYPVGWGMDSVEVWNSRLDARIDFLNRNNDAIGNFWDSILSSGRRLTGVGGSDTHFWYNHSLARPTTWVRAKNRTPEALVQAIQAGCVSISRSPYEVRLNLVADTDGYGTYETKMGGNVRTRGEKIRFKIKIAKGGRGPAEIVKVKKAIVKRMNKGRLKKKDISWLFRKMLTMGDFDLRFVTLIKNGKLAKAWITNKNAKKITFKSRPDHGSHSYYRVELYSGPTILSKNLFSFGKRTAVSNPIYFNY